MMPRTRTTDAASGAEEEEGGVDGVEAVMYFSADDYSGGNFANEK